MKLFLRDGPGRIYEAALLILVGVFVVAVFPHLALPYYWDESWVYGHGSRLMTITGPGLSPSSLPVDISRGHPLLFYFLAAAWMKIFGNTVFSSHVFALVVAIGLVVAVYLLCAKFFSKRVGFFAAAILMTQAIFLAQSCMVLPEVMLSMWVLLSAWAFFSGRKVLYVLFATFMLLTKETGIVCISAIMLNELLFDWFGPAGVSPRWQQPFREIKKYLVLVLPVALAAVHFLVQKKIYGWFFFPEHLHYISFRGADVVLKFRGYFSYTMIYYGRNGLLFGALAAAGIIFIRKKKGGMPAVTTNELRPLCFLGSYLLLFLLFSSINFYSDRYVMSCIAPFIIICVYVIDRALSNAALKWLAIAGIAGTGIFYSCTNSSNSDHNLGYVDAVHTYQQCVNFCVANKYQSKKIYANYLMEYALADTLSGYVNGRERFAFVSSHYNPETDLCIISNIEPTPLSDSVRKNAPLKLLKKFENGKASIELFEVVKNK